MTYLQAKEKHKDRILPIFLNADKPALQWVHIPPANCVELIIFDDDGPEGFFGRIRFERSRDAALFIKDLDDEEIMSLNFRIENHWSK